MRKNICAKTALAGAVLLLAVLSHGQAFTNIFTDTFSPAASPLWGNESGSWVGSNGLYRPIFPGNNPPAISSLPFNLADFSVDLDIPGVRDGGVYVRSTLLPSTPAGLKGVLVNLKNPNPGFGNLYFQIVVDGTNGTPPLGMVTAPYDAGSNPHLRIVVVGDTYSVYLNGSSTPATTLTTNLFPTGVVALYDNSSQSYSNVVLKAGCLPHRATATATVLNGFVVGSTITDGGCGYTNTPFVVFEGGGGSGAAGSAIVSNGVVVGINITDAGVGYTSTPLVFISSPFGMQISLIKAVKPLFMDVQPGVSYQLQTSSDLSTWLNQGPPFTPTNTTFVYPQYFDVGDWSQLFFRLQTSP